MPKLQLTPMLGHPLRDADISDQAASMLIEVEAGTTVLDAAISHGLAIATLCGGAMHCKMCRVEVHAPEAAGSPRGKREQDLLARLGAGATERLACQVRVLGDGVQVFVQNPLERLR